MPDPNVTSAEQLEALLRESKISQEEYETLRKAMDTAAAEESERWRHELRPRLSRSWRNRVLGGVCAGIAERFSIEPWRVRMISVFVFILTSWLGFIIYLRLAPASLTLVLTEGLTPLVYLVLFIVLPWKEEGVPTAGEGRRFPWGFACRLGGLWLLNIAAYFSLRSLLLKRLYEDLGRRLPTLTLFVVDLEGVFLLLYVGGFAMQFLILGTLMGLYLALPPSERARRIYAGTVYTTLLLLLLLVVAALCLPVFVVADAVL